MENNDTVGTCFILTVDERCGMELDETDPAIWLKLEAAIEEYIQKNSESFKNLCERLAPRYHSEKNLMEKLKTRQFSKSKPSNSGFYHSRIFSVA